jgi:hypothetical protein
MDEEKELKVLIFDILEKQETLNIEMRKLEEQKQKLLQELVKVRNG